MKIVRYIGTLKNHLRVTALMMPTNSFCLIARNFAFFWLNFIFVGVVYATEDKSLEGVWRGTIGHDDVRVCFSRSGATYYRLKQGNALTLSLLKSSADSNNWHAWEANHQAEKGEQIPTWELRQLDRNTIVGKREEISKIAKQEIRLKRNSVTEISGGLRLCELSFYEPLFQAVGVTSKEARFEGKPYFVISSKYGRSFQLPDALVNAPIINSFTRKLLDSEVVSAYDCDFMLNDWNGSRDSAWFNRHTPLVWTDDWLVIRSEQDYVYCGGAHGDANREELVIEMSSGKVVNPWRWIKGGEKMANPDIHDETSFRSLLLKYGRKVAMGKEKQFNSNFDEESYELNFYVGRPYPVSKGLVFTSRLGACRDLACDMFILVPYKALAPYLTNAGKAVAESFTSAASKH